jgi:type VI secretion system secreted protein Hcp
MPIYVEWDGITGDVTAKGFEKHIEVNSFQYGIGRGIGSPMGGSKDRESSAPSISEVVVTKPMDSASVALFESALYGEGKKVTAKFCKTDKDKLEVYLSYELQEVLVSGYSVSSGGDNPSESISLNFTKILMIVTPGGSLNETGSAMPTGWDLGLQSKM